jgi:arylformamidase
MKYLRAFLLVGLFASAARAQTIHRDIPYAGVDDKNRMLDVYSPADAKNLPVVFWIHGGGWQAGDKSQVKLKPQAFMDKGFVFVSVNYRLLPSVDMGTLIRDVAQSFKSPNMAAIPIACSSVGTPPGRSLPPSSAPMRSI